MILSIVLKAVIISPKYNQKFYTNSIQISDELN